MKAEDLAARGKADSASIYYQKLADLHYLDGLIIDYIYDYIDAAFLYTTTGRFYQAANLLKQVLPRLRTPADTDEQWAFLWLHIHLAHNYHQIGDYLQAKQLYEKALLDYVGQEHRNFEVANYLYRPLGNIYTRLGAHQQAYKLLERFREISMESGYFSTAAEALSDIGILFSDQRDYQKAQESYLQALDLPNVDNKSRALALSNLAGAYMELDLFQDAIRVSLESLKMLSSDELNGNPREILAYRSGVHNKLAHAYLEQSRFDLSNNHFKKALELSLEAYGTQKRRETAKIYLGLGQLNLKWQHPDKALNYFQQTLKAVLPDLSDDYRQNPSQGSLYAENSLMEALEGKALAYQQLFQQQHDLSILDRALACYELILEVEAELRKNYHESSKLFQVNESHQRSEQALDLAFALYETTPDSIHFWRAFQISEQARSVVLRESLQDQKAQNFAGIPDSLHVYERELKINLSLLRKSVIQLATSQDSSSHELEVKKEKVFELEQAQQQLSALLESQYPTYYKLKYQTSDLISMADIREHLLSDYQVLVEYFVGQRSLYIFKIDRQGLDFIRIDNDFQLQQQVEILLRSIRDLHSTPIATFESVAHALFDELVRPLNLKAGQSLLVIPDGILSHLPFATLLMDSTGSTNYKTLPYLIRDHAISYGYSLTLLRDRQAERVEGPRQKPFLGVAPIYRNSRNYAFLNHSESGIDQIQQELGGDKLVSHEATKEKFLSIANDYQMIHLSSHAQALDSLPVYSWISFSDAELPNEDDHKLYLSEIYALRIPAELIILGACETGTGQLKNGEGVMSLARGFVHAGCQSVVTTLWPVSNNATNQIMSGFYRYLVTGSSKNAALRQAQLDYLNHESTDVQGAHPFFWAPYIAIGDNKALQIPPSPGFSYKQLVLLVTGLVVISLLWVSRKKILNMF